MLELENVNIKKKKFVIRLARWSCKKGCKFETNSPMKMIKHNIVKHDAKYSVETIMKQRCNDHDLKNEVLRLVGFVRKKEF